LFLKVEIRKKSGNLRENPVKIGVRKTWPQA
jgi:hypothetical protein